MIGRAFPLVMALLCIAAIIAAGTILWLRLAEGTRQNTLLIDLACRSVQIRVTQNAPDAVAFEREFAAIYREHGVEPCQIDHEGGSP